MLGSAWRAALALTAAALIGAPPAAARAASLYSGPGPRPGPAILYRPLATAPQLTNAGIWHAPPILVSGTTAYRGGEFLYQDFLYDDHGAHELPDPTDPRAASEGDLFSKPNGTYTYPTGPGYVNDAADLVEFRVKPLAKATAFRVTLNSLTNPSLIAFSIAIGGTPGRTFPFPDGANVNAPADLFLTVHPDGGSRLTADLTSATRGTPVQGPSPTVRLDRKRRQIEVDIPHTDWNPGQRTVRLSAGVGLWDAKASRYLLPQAIADATHPGGAGVATNPPAFFNVAFRTKEPLPSVTAGPAAVIDAAWWRDLDQGRALAGNDISSLFADVNFAKLAAKTTDNRTIPTVGSINRILASHFEPNQGADFSHECGIGGGGGSATCTPEYQGQLEPYTIYVPRKKPSNAGYGMTLLLHSLSANYNQYSGSRNQHQFGERPAPSIVITPEARGPDQGYGGLGAADGFELWADVAHRYHLNPDYTEITGYSMGGVGTFKLGEQFPDLFARAQPTVGFESDTNLLPSLRNLPVLMWNNMPDELVNPAFYLPVAQKLASLGYRYRIQVFQPCANPKCLATPFPNHLQLALNDQFAPAAAFLGAAQVDRNPPHVTFVVDPARDKPDVQLVADHAYWVGGLTVRNKTAEGQIDAISHGLGTADPTPSGAKPGLGTLAGGNLGTLAFTSVTQTWGAAPGTARTDTLTITATNINTASINVTRAHLDCHAQLHVTTDGPLTIRLAPCGRALHYG